MKNRTNNIGQSADQPGNNSDLTVLIVDDDHAIRDSLSGYLQSVGWKTVTAENAEKALKIVDNGQSDIVITDVRMPGMSGIDFTRKVKEIDPDIEVLIATGHSTESLAIEALKAGAYDYFRKPLNAGDVAASLQRTRRFRDVKIENRRLKAVVARYTRVDELHTYIGNSPMSKTVMERVEKVAASPDTTILLTGESGVGKEVVARLIHKLSKPPGAPFIAVNCGGIAETLLEAELFGREKGAYTGADKMVPGVFELAAGGTVLLDEISEMSSQAQSRFLRVLEDRRLRRLGGTREIRIDDLRIIAATNRDLQERIKDGKFREDLYFRIMVAPLEIPPLRDRKSDIMLLAHHFLKICMNKTGKKFRFSAAAEFALLKHSYPGNIRELRNMIERATVFAAAIDIEPHDLGLETEPVAPAGTALVPGIGGNGDSAAFNLAEHERLVIQNAIARYPNNHSAVARTLGISPQALYRKIEKYEL